MRVFFNINAASFQNTEKIGNSARKMILTTHVLKVLFILPNDIMFSVSSTCVQRFLVCCLILSCVKEVRIV